MHRIFEYFRFWVTGWPIATKVGLSQDVSEIEAGSVIDIAVPNESLLVRDVTLPNLSAAALERAVNLEALRTSPFQKETISVGFKVLSRSKNNVVVRQYIARHSDLEKWCTNARSGGLQVRAVVPQEASNAWLADFTADLMQKTAIWRKANASFLVVILLLVVFSSWRSVSESEGHAMQAEARIAELRTEAARLKAQLDDIDARSLGLRLVEAKQAQAVEYLAQVDRLTQLMPNDAWVNHLAVDGAIMKIVGNVSGEPLVLLEQIASAPGFGAPILTASFALNDGAGGQRFEIEVPVGEAQP